MKYTRVDIPVGNYFIPVFFWKKKKYFRKAIGDSDACFMYLNAKKRYPLLGEMHFVRGLIDVGIVAHEITHASLCLAERLRMNNEELICETSQVITSNLWKAILDNKKLRKWIYGKGRE